MSYDLHLLHVSTGETAAAVLDRRFEQQAVQLNPGPAVPLLEEEKRRLVDGLMRHSPVLGIAEFDFAATAMREGIDEAEARRRYRHVELNSDDYTGIQITFWDDSVDLTFPYWHSGQQAARVVGQVWEYLDVLQRWGEFVIFDPQLDRVLDLNRDVEEVLSFVLNGRNSTHDALEAKRQPNHWKLW